LIILREILICVLDFRIIFILERRGVSRRKKKSFPFTRKPPTLKACLLPAAVQHCSEQHSTAVQSTSTAFPIPNSQISLSLKYKTLFFKNNRKNKNAAKFPLNHLFSEIKEISRLNAHVNQSLMHASQTAPSLQETSLASTLAASSPLPPLPPLASPRLLLVSRGYQSNTAALATQLPRNLTPPSRRGRRPRNGARAG